MVSLSSPLPLRLMECDSSTINNLGLVFFLKPLTYPRCPTQIGYRREFGSPLFSVELELGEAELAGGEVKHGHQVRGGTAAARFAFGRTEDAVPAFHERIGHAPLPVRHHACQMVLDQWPQLDHRSQETGVVKACHPAPQRHQTWKRRRARVAVGLRWMSWSTSRI